jgi:hypothetical protein
MDWLRSQRPDLVARYEEMYRRGAYAPREVRERLSRLARAPGAPVRQRRFLRDLDTFGHPRGTAHQDRHAVAPEQATLF